MFRKITPFIGFIALAVSCSTSIQSTSVLFKDYRIEKQTKTDSSLVKMLQPYATSMNASMNKVIGFSNTNLVKKQPESGLGNFMADAMLVMAEKKFGKKIDGAFMNEGGIRSEISKGNITTGKIFELMPFDNIIVVQDVKGAVLKQFLDKTAADGGWPVSKGISMGIKEKKAINVTINGKPLDNNATYAIVNSDYVANGGSDCAMLKGIPFLNKGYLLRDALIEYVKALTSEGKPLDFMIEKRVVNVN